MLLVNELLPDLFGIHIFWLYCFTTGTLVRTTKQKSPAVDSEAELSQSHMADLVITTATGIAITGFVLLLLGSVGLLSVVGLVLWFVLEALLFKLVKDENIFGVSFWANRLQAIKRAWSVPALIIYAVFLLISVPAILPPTLWDSISYHLAYAVDWANSGHIYVDQFLRFPYYANNFVLIYALMFVLKLGPLCHFTTWLCGLLTALGVFSLISAGETRQPGAWWRRFGFALKNTVVPLTIATSPVFLRYVNVGYVDVPIGFFTLVPILCTYLILKGSERHYEIDVLITSAFCVGMKISAFLCLPLFLFSLFIVLRRQRRKMSHVVALSALMILLSSPWYLRNFVMAGDPIAPALNLLIRRRDPIFTPADYSALKADLQTRKGVTALLLLPVNLLNKPQSPDFREYGVNLSVLLLYLPLCTLLLLLLKPFRTRVGLSFIYLNGATIYLLANWLSISTFARYFLQVFPVYVGYLGVCFNIAAQYAQTIGRDKRALPFALELALFVFLLIIPIPSPSSKKYYEEIWLNNYLGLSERLMNRSDFFRRDLPGYVATQTIINSLYADRAQSKRVLVLGFENLSFYFRKRNVVSVGDWFGPGRYADLVTAVDNSDLASYLSRFDIGAVLINLTDKRISEKQYQSFIKQLESNHFTLKPNLEAGTAVYLETN
jgi:hypothetical protein